VCLAKTEDKKNGSYFGTFAGLHTAEIQEQLGSHRIGLKISFYKTLAHVLSHIDNKSHIYCGWFN
jgi:hypothetical protein